MDTNTNLVEKGRALLDQYQKKMHESKVYRPDGNGDERTQQAFDTLFNDIGILRTEFNVLLDAYQNLYREKDMLVQDKDMDRVIHERREFEKERAKFYAEVQNIKSKWTVWVEENQKAIGLEKGWIEREKQELEKQRTGLVQEKENQRAKSRQLEAWQRDIDRIRNELETQEKKAREMHSEMEQKKAEFDEWMQIEKTKSSETEHFLELKKTNFEQEVEKREQMLEELTRELERERLEIDQNSAKVKTLQDLSSMYPKIELLMTQKLELSQKVEEMEVLERQKALLEMHQRDLEAEIGSLKQILEEKEVNKGMIHACEQNILRLEEERTVLIRQVESAELLEMQVRDFKDKVEELTREKNLLESEVIQFQDLEQQEQVLQQKIQTLIQTNRELEDRRDQLRVQIGEAGGSEELEYLKEEVRVLEVEREQLESAVRNLEQGVCDSKTFPHGEPQDLEQGTNHGDKGPRSILKKGGEASGAKGTQLRFTADEHASEMNELDMSSVSDITLGNYSYFSLDIPQCSEELVKSYETRIEELCCLVEQRDKQLSDLETCLRDRDKTLEAFEAELRQLKTFAGSREEHNVPLNAPDMEDSSLSFMATHSDHGSNELLRLEDRIEYGSEFCEIQNDNRAVEAALAYIFSPARKHVETQTPVDLAQMKQELKKSDQTLEWLNGILGDQPAEPTAWDPEMFKNEIRQVLSLENEKIKEELKRLCEWFQEEYMAKSQNIKKYQSMVEALEGEIEQCNRVLDDCRGQIQQLTASLEFRTAKDRLRQTRSRYWKARCKREIRYRSDLIFQKKYLVLMLSSFERSSIRPQHGASKGVQRPVGLKTVFRSLLALVRIQATFQNRVRIGERLAINP